MLLYLPYSAADRDTEHVYLNEALRQIDAVKYRIRSHKKRNLYTLGSPCHRAHHCMQGAAGKRLDIRVIKFAVSIIRLFPQVKPEHNGGLQGNALRGSSQNLQPL